MKVYVIIIDSIDSKYVYGVTLNEESAIDLCFIKNKRGTEVRSFYYEEFILDDLNGN